jgi:chromosomal replication initiator protein
MSGVSEALWADILAQVRINNPDLVRGWFTQLSPIGLDQGILEIRAVNSGQQRYLSDHCLRAFVEAAQAATGRLVTVRFSFQEEARPAPVTELPPLSFEQETEEVALNPNYVFDQFVTGPCNRLAHAACVAVSEAPGRAYNPLFLHGSAGMGKTHLLQATCHRILELSDPARVLYLSCETFTNHFIEAVEHGAMHTFRDRYRHVDVLVIDDIQFLAARERSQEEFFHTFNKLHQLQKQIILSADSPPSEIPSLEERLVSRFNWGLVARLDPPCLDTRIAIIRKKARNMGLEVGEDACLFIATRVTANTRELEGALLRIHALATCGNNQIDLALAQQALGDEPAPPRLLITMENILQAVTEHYAVPRKDVQSRKRSKSIAFPRQICMFLARTLTQHSLQEIGGFFGGRDHSTVLHATRSIETLRDSDTQFRSTLDTITSSLRH